MPALKVWAPYERLTATDLNADFASVQAPDGVVASSGTSTTTSTPIPLTTLIEGKASLLAGGRIVTPRAGLYLVSGMVLISNVTTPGQYTFTIVGPGTVFQTYIAGGASDMFIFGLPMVLGAGVQITGQYTSLGGTVGCTIQRIGFLFLGTGYAP